MIITPNTMVIPTSRKLEIPRLVNKLFNLNRSYNFKLILN